MNVVTDALNQADKTMHSLAQLMAQTAMQWLSAQPDDSQANLGWHPDHGRLEGRAFSLNGPLVRLVADTNTFDLQFLDQTDQIMASFSPDNRTPAEAQAWWVGQMQAWGKTDFRALNYHIDPLPVAEQTRYKRPAALSNWAHWRTVAAVELAGLTDWSGQVCEVRIWPHHFDTGVYYGFPDEKGQECAAIWAGYSIADTLCGEPYFYLSGYRAEQPIRFSEAPSLPSGSWLVTPGWQGAMLPISDVPGPEVISLFLRSSYSWLRNMISEPGR